MDKFYTVEKNVQILISLLKKNNIRKIIVSPGTSNITFVGSIQNDRYFEIYSSVDERSAAYIACGMAAESGEPVVITCTGATASRNYMSGLTEAYYKKLPILAVTASHPSYDVGHLIAQVTDRSQLPNDIVYYHTELGLIKDNDDEWNCIVKTNEALSYLTSQDCGPVHINLISKCSDDFGVKELPEFRYIQKITKIDNDKSLINKKVGIFIGSHSYINEELQREIESFCEKYDAIVFCDHTSNYYGLYKANYSIIGCQENYDSDIRKMDVLIQIGEVSGEYYTLRTLNPTEVWRVSLDGKFCDTFRKLTAVFKMDEFSFFSSFNKKTEKQKELSYYRAYQEEYNSFIDAIPDLPFSNIWIAKNYLKRVPKGACIHFSILNSLRSWNFFNLGKTVTANSNVGGFGIDGPMSTIIGAALSNKEKLYFLVVGDLAFFYDLNSLGNRYLPNNIRILLINNGRGIEFRKYDHPGARFGEEADRFIAAGGHFGNKSHTLVKGFTESLGIEYLTAQNKDEFEKGSEIFFSEDMRVRPMVMEVFTDTENESNALKIMKNLKESKSVKFKTSAKQAIKSVIGQSGIDNIKSILGK